MKVTFLLQKNVIAKCQEEMWLGCQLSKFDVGLRTYFVVFICRMNQTCCFKLICFIKEDRMLEPCHINKTCLHRECKYLDKVNIIILIHNKVVKSIQRLYRVCHGFRLMKLDDYYY